MREKTEGIFSLPLEQKENSVFFLSFSNMFHFWFEVYQLFIAHDFCHWTKWQSIFLTYEFPLDFSPTRIREGKIKRKWEREWETERKKYKKGYEEICNRKKKRGGREKKRDRKLKTKIDPTTPGQKREEIPPPPKVPAWFSSLRKNAFILEGFKKLSSNR